MLSVTEDIPYEIWITLYRYHQKALGRNTCPIKKHSDYLGEPPEDKCKTHPSTSIGILCPTPPTNKRKSNVFLASTRSRTLLGDHGPHQQPSRNFHCWSEKIQKSFLLFPLCPTENRGISHETNFHVTLQTQKELVNPLSEFIFLLLQTTNLKKCSVRSFVPSFIHLFSLSPNNKRSRGQQQ